MEWKRGMVLMKHPPFHVYQNVPYVKRFMTFPSDTSARCLIWGDSKSCRLFFPKYQHQLQRNRWCAKTCSIPVLQVKKCLNLRQKLNPPTKTFDSFTKETPRKTGAITWACRPAGFLIRSGVLSSPLHKQMLHLKNPRYSHVSYEYMYTQKLTNIAIKNVHLSWCIPWI